MPVLFDLDDTLLDDHGAQEAYFPRLYRSHAHALPHANVEEFAAAWRAAIARHFARYVAGEISATEQRRERVREVFGRADMPLAEIDAFVSDFLAAYEASWCLFADVLPALDALRSVQLGVITNGLSDQQAQKLRRTGILDRFRVVVVSQAVGHAKPAPQIFAHACAQLGCAARECVFVGDDWHNDVEGSLGAGMSPVWLNRRRTTARAGGASVATIETLAELVEHAGVRAMLGLLLLVLACAACSGAPSTSHDPSSGGAAQNAAKDAGGVFGNAAGHASDPPLTLIDDGGAGMLPDGAIVYLALWARPCPTGNTLTYESFGRRFFERYCLHCHSAALAGRDRGGAPQSVNFDTLDAIAARKDAIWHMAADANMEMPASGPAPSPAERRQLGDWLACGAVAGGDAAAL